MRYPRRIFLDTNVYLIGLSTPSSPDGQILAWLKQDSSIVLLISLELIDQIRRVAKRLLNKDGAGNLLSQLWQDYPIELVTIIPSESEPAIPREDWDIYLAAKQGRADCFVSNNRELIRAIADFDCLMAQEFVDRYL